MHAGDHSREQNSNHQRPSSVFFEKVILTVNLSFHLPLYLQFELEFVLFCLIITVHYLSSKRVTGEPHVHLAQPQILGRKGVQPPISLQYIIWYIEFKRTLINLLSRNITVASACMEIIIEYILAALV